MIQGSLRLLGFALGLFPAVAALADTIPGVTVERRVNLEAQTALVIDERVTEPSVAANVSDGGVLVGSRIVWTAIVGPGFKRFSYELDVPECRDGFPVWPG